MTDSEREQEAREAEERRQEAIRQAAWARVVIGAQLGPTSASKRGPPGFKGTPGKPAGPALHLLLSAGTALGYGPPAG